MTQTSSTQFPQPLSQQRIPPPSSKRPHKAFAADLAGAWRLQARPEQLPPPGLWTTWVFCGGRGSGKTRSGAEWIQERVSTGARYIHLVAPTAADCRDVLLEGPAGILSIAQSDERPVYQPSLRKLVWPNGAQALLFSSDEPDRLRGPQCDTLWIDELCAMRQAQQVLDNAFFGLRQGKDVRCLITTTPRPIKSFKALLAREGQDVVLTRSSSYANRENLAPQFFAQIISKYEGTRLGRQEIEAELLTDTPGALWSLERIEELRVNRAPEPFERVVVAIDPAVTFGPDSDETGIVVVGLAGDGSAYVLDDMSGRYPPSEWAQRAITAYRIYRGDRIIGEVNNGGAMVEHTLRSVDPGIPFKAVHASRGKLTRAEPISALYEQGRVHHVGVFGPLEDQLTSYDGSRSGSSPDRLDALCWGIHELMLGEPAGGFIREQSLLRAIEPNSVTRAPIEMPSYVDGIFAIAAAGVGPEPDAIGVVYMAFTGAGSATPLIVVDWSIEEIEPATFMGLFPAVFGRLDALRCETKTLYSGHGLAIEPAAVGGVLLEQGLLGRHHVMSIDQESILAMTFHQRVVAASAHVNAGRVLLTRAAHEKLTLHKGVLRNHFLHQLAAFGMDKQQQADDPGVLLTAFADGVLDTFSSPRMQVRAQ